MSQLCLSLNKLSLKFSEGGKQNSSFKEGPLNDNGALSPRREGHNDPGLRPVTSEQNKKLGHAIVSL